MYTYIHRLIIFSHGGKIFSCELDALSEILQLSDSIQSKTEVSRKHNSQKHNRGLGVTARVHLGIIATCIVSHKLR